MLILLRWKEISVQVYMTVIHCCGSPLSLGFYCMCYCTQLLKEEMASEKLFSPVTPVEKKKKKGGAHKLLKKLRKKQTRKVSEIPPNQILFSRVPMETISPPSGDKGYQNIFDFEQRDHPSVRKCESISKTPKKPMVRSR